MLRPSRLTGLLPVAALGALAGCVEPEERSTYWPALHATIIEPSCATAGCHSAVAAQSGLDLSTPNTAYTMLVGRICGEPDVPGQAPGNFVFPGDPSRSVLIHQLRGNYRDRMPPDRPLPDAEITLIERWIEEGAPCD